MKKAERNWQAQSDSMTNIVVQKQKALLKKARAAKDGLNTKLYNKVYRPWARKQSMDYIMELDKSGLCPSPAFRLFIAEYLENYFLKTTQNDSMIMAVKERFPSIQMPKQLTSRLSIFKTLNPDKVSAFKLANGKLSDMGEMRKLKSEFSKYNQYGKIFSNPDTIKGFAKAEGKKAANELVSRAEGLTQMNELKGKFGEVNKMKSMPDQYKGQMEQLQDSAYVKEQAKKKAEDLAMKYISANPGIMEGVQRKMSLLMRKYSVVPNSNDLSTAIKRSSLKGKTFRERLVLATNFQLLNLNPVSIDFSPQAGYKFNRKFVVGIGGTYRQTFKDSIPKLAPQVFGYKIFTTYEVLNTFFLYGEYDRNSPGMSKKENQAVRIWKDAMLAGIGRKFTIRPKIEMTLTVAYDFLFKPGDPIYARPWVVRIGFQTSELAMLKRKVIP